jgi:hypothetical protein
LINEGGKMRFKWEYTAFIGVLMAVAAAVASCSKDSTSPVASAVVREAPQPSQQKLADLQSRYGWTGKYHTDALAHVYSKLSRGKSLSSRAERCHVALAALKEFNKTFSKDGKSKGLSDSFVSDDLCSGNGQVAAQTQVGATSDLSPKAQAILQRIPNLFDFGASSASIVASVNGIENSAIGTLNADEAAAVVSLGSVAISSAQYWDANLADWRGVSSAGGPANNRAPATIHSSVNLANPTGGTPRHAASSNASIGKADAFAFFSSLLAGWWMGALDIEISAVRAVIASMLAAI